MSKKPRYFVLISHCLLNPATRVHVLGRSFTMAQKISSYLLEKNISIIQLPCPEFTAMGYWRNPQGRQQYDNIFFRKHCKKELESFVDMVCELKRNNNTPLCFIGIQGSPTCSVYWGKHKLNKYKTESINPDLSAEKGDEVFGVLTEVLDEMLKDCGIDMPFLEAPVKENIESDISVSFFNDLDDLLHIPESYRKYKDSIENVNSQNNQ